MAVKVKDRNHQRPVWGKV